jgi:3'-phosphoadenosine 5'-phosphosulfate sulfotransferase (PAPS reductase)/FAD synthetase
MFRDGKTLVVTGERAEESPNRARYKVFEPHRADNRHGRRVIRHVDHWRPCPFLARSAHLAAYRCKERLVPHVSILLSGAGRAIVS